MKGLNLEHFKKVQEDDNSATFQHSDGHKIHVAKSALSEKMRDQLKSLPLHAAGGTGVIPDTLAPNEDLIVQDAMAGRGLPTNEDVVNQRFENQFNPGGLSFSPEHVEAAREKYIPMIERQLVDEKKSSQEQSQTAGQDMAERNKNREFLGMAPVGGQAPQQGYQVPQMQMPGQQGQSQRPDMFAGANNDMFQRGVKEGESAINQQQRIESDLGKQNATLISANVAEKQLAKTDFDTRMQTLIKNHEAFVKDYRDHPIVADQLMKNMGGGQRVMTAIGLILGGMGGGLTGQENPALKFLQQKIEQDIQGQMKNQNDRHTLIGANHEAMGDLRTAYHASVASMNDFLASKIQEAAAKSSDPMAKQRATAAMSQLHMANADHLRSIEMQQGLMSQMGAAQKSGQNVDPAMRIRAFVPNPAEQDKYFKELKDMEDAVGARDNVAEALHKVAKLNTVGNRVLNPFQTKAQIAAIKGPIVAALSKATAGRFTEQDSAMLDPIFKDAFDNPGTVNEKINAAMRVVNQGMHFPMMRNIGVDHTQMGKYTPQGKSRIPEAPPMLRK